MTLLRLVRRDLRAEPLSARRRAHKRVTARAGELVPPVRRLPADGVEAWAEVQRRATRGSWRRTRLRCTAVSRRGPD